MKEGPRFKSKSGAYIVGVALGDGNLSNPNGRAIRLRVTCDAKYPGIKNEICLALRFLFPANKVSLVKKTVRCYDISVYSNLLPELMPWRTGMGPKIAQQVHVPDWILSSKTYTKECLRGLFQTDGSIYADRGYLMVNFTNNSKKLAQNVYTMVSELGFEPTFHIAKNKSGSSKFTVRIARDSFKFTQVIKLKKM